MKILNSPPGSSSGFGTLSAIAGLLCALHCMLLPLATGALVALGISPFRSPQAEVVLMMGAASLAILSFWPRAIRDGNTFPLQVSVLAVAFFLTGWQSGGMSPLVRQSLSVSGGLLLVLAHAQNTWSARRRSAPQCP